MKGVIKIAGINPAISFPLNKGPSRCGKRYKPIIYH